MNDLNVLHLQDFLFIQLYRFCEEDDPDSMYEALLKASDSYKKIFTTSTSLSATSIKLSPRKKSSLISISWFAPPKQEHKIVDARKKGVPQKTITGTKVLLQYVGGVEKM